MSENRQLDPIEEADTPSATNSSISTPLPDEEAQGENLPAQNRPPSNLGNPDSSENRPTSASSDRPASAASSALTNVTHDSDLLAEAMAETTANAMAESQPDSISSDSSPDESEPTAQTQFDKRLSIEGESSAASSTSSLQTQHMRISSRRGTIPLGPGPPLNMSPHCSLTTLASPGGDVFASCGLASSTYSYSAGNIDNVGSIDVPSGTSAQPTVLEPSITITGPVPGTPVQPSAPEASSSARSCEAEPSAQESAAPGPSSSAPCVAPELSSSDSSGASGPSSQGQDNKKGKDSSCMKILSCWKPKTPPKNTKTTPKDPTPTKKGPSTPKKVFNLIFNKKNQTPEIVETSPVIEGTPPVIVETTPENEGTPPVIVETPPVIVETPPVIVEPPQEAEGTPPQAEGTPQQPNRSPRPDDEGTSKKQKT